jgi:hypothetical protein
LTAEERIEWAHMVCADMLDQLHAKVFTPEMKLTLVARHPDKPDVNLVLTKDDMQDVINLLVEHQATGK